MNYCSSNGIQYNIWTHPDTNTKIEIGYESEEVAITLAYAKDNAMTHFFVFTRPNDQPDIKIPRSTVRKYVGIKDLKYASQQAIENLEEIMEQGQIGPFPSNPNDMIYIDLASHEKSQENPSYLVNFATGISKMSFNMRLYDAAEALKELYPGRVNVVDLFS